MSASAPAIFARLGPTAPGEHAYTSYVKSAAKRPFHLAERQ
jgi:hypothetical protein